MQRERMARSAPRTDEALRRRGALTGDSRLLEKPFSPAALLEAVEALLEKAEA